MPEGSSHAQSPDLRLSVAQQQSAAPSASDDTWVVSETFLSVQGEGKLAGVPTFFIRVSGCNLRCSWCDTPYASWKPEGSRRSFAQLLSEIQTTPARYIVLTGGEPMIAPGLAEFTDRLKTATSPGPAQRAGVVSSAEACHDYHITIETAGTVPPPPGLRCDLMSISPKLANSTPAHGDPRDPGGAWRTRHEARRLNPAAIADLIRSSSDFQLKFVIAAESDLPEIESVIECVHGEFDSHSGPSTRRIEPADILLMPEGVTLPSRETEQRVVQACIARGWRYCPRLHISIFGNKRGT